MFIEDIKNDFYNVLLGKRVLLLVHCDVDAVCACKILLDLFKCDNIAYTLVPVGSITELKSAYEENKEEVKFVVLINCGGTIDLVDVLQPDEDVVFFVLDAHKPTDVCNVYSDGQVRLVYRDGEENIPNFDDIFRDDEEDEEEEDDGSLEALTDRRRARREWELKRDTLMFNYTQFSYLGKPSGATACSLSSMLGRLGGAWAGGVAAAARRADQPELLETLLTNRHDSTQAERVVLEKDVCLPLYRMWTLEESIKHCPVLGPQLKVHTVAGEQKVKQLLTEMGYPLAQARQQYRSMCVTLRHGLVEALTQAAGTARGITRLVAVLRRNTAPDMSAIDVAVMLMALLEQETWEERCEGFKDSLSALNPGPAGDEARAKGLRRAIALLKAARECASVPPVVTAAATLYIVPHTSGIPGPTWLAVSAMWVRRQGKPTIAILEGPHTSLVYGLPPSGDTHTNNLFGAAFSQAASQSGVEITRSHLDAAVVSVHNPTRAHFLQALTHLLH